ncbi:MAG: TrkA family potassium uptake protein [Prolixibacteraceae bacterium]|nr:TrkA family potassium uptake protein [Prolixibacteraceae bacterium]
MKFIVIGLGYFGSTLAVTLTKQGHEVIGIDNNWDKIEEFKDSITHTMSMDTTNERAVKTLPLDDTDAVIVAIGEDVSSSILTLAILKNLNVKRIIGRIISPIHKSIINQIGIDEVIHPEEEAAYSIISQLHLDMALKVYEFDEYNALAEIYVPKKYVGHSLDSINAEERFGIKIVAVKVAPKKGGILNFSPKDYVVDYKFDRMAPLKEKDILIIAGALPDLRKLNEL